MLLSPCEEKDVSSDLPCIPKEFIRLRAEKLVLAVVTGMIDGCIGRPLLEKTAKSKFFLLNKVNMPCSVNQPTVQVKCDI